VVAVNDDITVNLVEEIYLTEEEKNEQQAIVVKSLSE